MVLVSLLSGDKINFSMIILVLSEHTGGGSVLWVLKDFFLSALDRTVAEVRKVVFFIKGRQSLQPHSH